MLTNKTLHKFFDNILFFRIGGLSFSLQLQTSYSFLITEEKGECPMTEEENRNKGYRGEDPQPQRGNDSKGHQDRKGGIVTKPGTSHSLTMSQ